MGKFMHTQNCFALGEVSPDFFGRTDLVTASKGLMKLENMDVLPSGALRRRCGTVRLFQADAGAVLVPFQVAEDENYLLVISTGHIKIYDSDSFIQNLILPWTAPELKSMQYAQRFGTMIFVHPMHRPVVLKKDPNGAFSLDDFHFSVNDNTTENIPFIKFDDANGIKITVTTHPNGNTSATFTTSAPFWKPSNVFSRLFMMNRQWTITEYVSPTVAVAQTSGSYTLPSAPISDWRESAFSDRRGWPRSITFHQNRLVFGGSLEWPCGIWMSKVGDHNNFDTGTGLDDEAIFLTLLSSVRQDICTVASSDNLQILTTAGEWAISSKPLTPSTIDIKQHTSTGSISTHYLQPQKVEGCTVFVSQSGHEIRELVLDTISQNYSAVDLCALSSHLMKTPVDIAYDDRSHRLFVPMEDGSMATLTKIGPLSISAWGVYKTFGSFKSVACMNGEVFVAVQRDTGTFVEKFSDIASSDSGAYGFSYTASGMPLSAAGHTPKKVRLTKLSARVMDTKSLFFRVGDTEMRAPLPNHVQAPDAPGYTGDTSVNLLGTDADTMRPLWTITGSEPLPLTVLSITAEGRYSI